MIVRPVIGSTTLLTIVISMKGIPIIPLLSSQWVMKLFTPLQRANRVDCCEELLENCNQDPTGFSCHIVSGNDTWIYQYDPLSQQEAKTWKKEGEKTPSRSRRVTRSTGKIIITIFSDCEKVLFLSIFYHVLLQSMVHITYHSSTYYTLLFERSLCVVYCSFTTTYLFTNSKTDRVDRIKSSCTFSRPCSQRLSSVPKLEDFSSWQEF